MSSGSFQPPPFNLYAQSGPGSNGADPYFCNPPAVVNLSGKIGPPNDPPQTSSSTASLISAVTSAVETSYQSARNVMLGGGGNVASVVAESSPSQSTFSIFSLSYQQLANFAICILLGTFFMFLAFLFLPMVVFAPQKFTLLFTLGSLSWMAGLAMLQGPRSLMSAMVKKERMSFTLAYGLSLLGTFYATMVAHSYILTMLFAIIQISALVAFVISYFPGGSRMLAMVKDIMFSRVKGLFGGSGGSTSSVLPL